MKEELLGRLNSVFSHQRHLDANTEVQTQENRQTDGYTDEKETGVGEGKRGQKRERETERGERVKKQKAAIWRDCKMIRQRQIKKKGETERCSLTRSTPALCHCPLVAA